MEGVQWGVVLGGIPTLPAWAPLISAGAVSWSRQRTRAPAAPPGPLAAPGLLEPAPSARRWGTPLPSARHRGSPGEPRALFALPSARGPLPAPRWPIECEVIKETIEHIEWVPPEPEPFCQPTGPHWAPAALGEEHGTVVYHLSPAPRGSCFTRARIGGAPGPLSSPAAPLEGPQDTTLVFESRFESGNLQKAVKVGPYEYVLMLRPDLYTAKHTQWFYFRVQNTRRGPLYRFTIANMAKPKSLYGEGMRPLFYSQRDAQSRGIGWRRIGADVRYYRGSGGEKPAAFHLSWTARFPHDGDTCFFAHSYPYTYSDLQRYLWALAGDPVRSQYCAVRALCRSLAGNTVYLLTITSPTGAAAKRAVVLSARAHPGESGGSWAMRGFLDFLLSTDADAQLLRRLFVFKVVPMLNPDGVVVGNSRCSLAGRDPNRAYGTALCGSFPGVWHLRAMVKRVLAEREVVLYCDFHGHSRKNNVFMYGCDGGGAEAGLRLCQRVFPLMLSKNAPDKFSFPSCKFKVQKSKAGTGRVVMWRMGVSNSYTMEAAFGGSTLGEGPLPAGADGVGCVGGRAGWSPGLGSCRLFPFPLSSPGGRSSHFTVEDLKSLGYHLCDTLLDFCDPDPTKFQQCLSEVDVLLRQRLGWEPGSGGSWSDVSPSELESSTSGSDSSVSDGSLAHLCGPAWPLEQGRRKRLRSRRARNALRRTNAVYWSRASVPVSLGPQAWSTQSQRARLGPSRTRRQPALPSTPTGGSVAGEEPRTGSSVTFPSAARAGAGRHAATEGSQLDGGTSAVSRRRPPLSIPHPGVTGDCSQDTAPGAETKPSRRRGGQATAASRHRARPPLTACGRASPPAAPRCCACARH
ncbi:cytosolic carboxypeptidase 2 isoform X2 [Buteo buteo]|uniref:cytosolic carboxypeptidase 2 isoform X2 n=1 Tax=Buteo buteo TaxID=30397 RepID=UPI003EBED25D